MLLNRGTIWLVEPWTKWGLGHRLFMWQKIHLQLVVSPPFTLFLCNHGSASADSASYQLYSNLVLAVESYPPTSGPNWFPLMLFKGQLYIDEVQRWVGIGSIKGYIPAGSTQNWVHWDGKCLPAKKEEICSVLLPARTSARQYPNQMLEDKMFSSKTKEKGN